MFTLLSSWIGSGSLLAGAENAYRHGFAALWQGGGGWVGLVLIFFIAPRARKFAQFTIPDLLEARYNQAARVLGVIAVLFTYTAITSYQLIGGGDILHLIFPDAVSAIGGRYILAGFVIVFTAIAGMASVAYMDVVIGSLTTVTLLVALPILIHHAGGWGAVHAALPATHFQVLGDFQASRRWNSCCRRACCCLATSRCIRSSFRRRSERDARNAVIGWIVGTVILETVIVAIAVTGSVLFPAGEVHENPREILAFSAMHGLQGSGPLLLLGALMMGAIFAKVISTANNYLFSPATNLVNDVFVRYIRPKAADREVLLVSRLMIVLLGVWALWQSLGTTSVLKKSLYAYTIYGAALTPVILAAFFWRRATAAGAVVSIALGTVVTVGWDSPLVARVLPPLIAQRDAIVPALLVSVVALVVISLLTPPPSEEQLRPFAAD